MNDTAPLYKILHIRENEKKHAEQMHQQSVSEFEHFALKMYETLKKKEDVEDDYERNISHSVSLEKMERFTRFIEQLNQQVFYMQKQVNDSRTEMDKRQRKVTNAHMEMKKVEKLIEFRSEENKQRMAKKENAFMDELSMQQFLKRKLGGSIV